MKALYQHSKNLFQRLAVEPEHIIIHCVVEFEVKRFLSNKHVFT